jgi:hypothetical protein
MVKAFYILGISSLWTACAILMLSVWQWREVDPRQEAFLRAPSAVRRFTEGTDERLQEGVDKASLMAQAEMLASLLAPARLILGGDSGLVSPPEPSEPIPPIRSMAALANFKVYGTSCYPNEPQRSMALIAEPGIAEGQERWVKEGAQIGHFVIHEIRRGVVVYSDGGQLHEMAVEHRMSRTSLVRSVQGGSLKVSAAVGNWGTIRLPPAGPDDIEIGSGQADSFASIARDNRL